ncbi:hypothetical protein SAMN04487896_3440 [Paenibacillus sp. ov031]|uniref:hypothetical protein n=1 Tax=Paenibacillus sp. ov031 TaxID=1761879 RepID=UPI000913FB7C|nr:hypothetical protein [Paenibacillus sp. ov031]SHN74276.1 hypothetical protein SAMN04487896_3440 [Paenibacillus sp. ov031]
MTMPESFFAEIECNAQILWGSIKDDPYPNREMLKEFADGQELLRFSDYEDVRRKIDSFRSFAYAKCSIIDVEHALPILLQMYTNFYSVCSSAPSWLGTAIKYSVAVLWEQLTEGVAKGTSRETDDIKQALLSIHILNDLESSLYLECFICEPFSLDSEGLHGSDDFHQVLNDFYQSFREGYLQRTWGQYVNVFMSDIPGALRAVERVMNGESPSKIKKFENTIFSGIKKSEPIEFWLGIWARLKVFMVSLGYRDSSQYVGISIIPDHIPILSSTKIGREKLQKAIQDLFWTNEWYEHANNNKINMYDMLISRPVIRIKNEEKCYVTSFFLIMDSLGNFIEDSMMGYSSSPVKLSKKFRKKFISDKFEHRIIERLRIAGHTSGRVETNGIWYTENGEMPLKVKGKKLSGEIDVLAYRPDKKLLVILECKVYELPSSPNQMRNLLNKFGSADRKKVHQKLDAKLEWVLKSEFFADKELTLLRGLMLDRKFPGMYHDGFNVMDPKLFEEVLQQMEEVERIPTEDSIR